jgi:hypothetical protein
MQDWTRREKKFAAVAVWLLAVVALTVVLSCSLPLWWRDALPGAPATTAAYAWLALASLSHLLRVPCCARSTRIRWRRRLYASTALPWLVLMVAWPVFIAGRAECRASWQWLVDGRHDVCDAYTAAFSLTMGLGVVNVMIYLLLLPLQ